MSNENRSIREALLERDAIADAETLGYETHLRELFDRKLSTWGRLRYLVPTVAGLIMAMALTSLAATEPESTPTETRAVLVVLACIGAFWFVVCGRILLRGSVNLISDRRTVTSAALGFSVLQSVYFASKSIDGGPALSGLILSVVFVVVAGALYRSGSPLDIARR